MNSFFRNTLAALVLASTGIAASAPAANAGGVGFEFSFGGGHGGITVRDHRRHGSWGRGSCRPGKAVRKARHMGVRRASISRVNHRRVVVSGVRHHRSVRVVFANQRHCPVIRVRR